MSYREIAHNQQQQYRAALQRLWKGLQRGDAVSPAARNKALRSADAVQPRNPRRVHRAKPEHMRKAVALPKGTGGVAKVDRGVRCAPPCTAAVLTAEQFHTALEHGVRVNSRSMGMLR